MKTKQKQQIFKQKYVLGEGYPWCNGVEPFKDIGLQKEVVFSKNIVLKFPKELWKVNVPKYRLVLEKIN